MRPRFWSNLRFRVNVVRSVTVRSASFVTVAGPNAIVAAKMPNCVARRPTGRNASSNNCVTARAAWRMLPQAQARPSSCANLLICCSTVSRTIFAPIGASRSSPKGCLSNESIYTYFPLSSIFCRITTAQDRSSQSAQGSSARMVSEGAYVIIVRPVTSVEGVCMPVVAPEWVKDAVFYQIFPDRFAKSSRLPKNLNFEPWDSPPTLLGFKGGDLLGVIEHLDYLQELGITALYFNPVFASAANHRYHTYDYFIVDPLLGGNAALRELIDAAHGRNIRIVLDGVFNHASRGFWQFHHTLENRAASPHPDWFHFHPDRL